MRCCGHLRRRGPNQATRKIWGQVFILAIIERFLHEDQVGEKQDTNGKASMFTSSPPFALSLSKPVLGLSKGVNGAFFSTLLDVMRSSETGAAGDINQ